MTRTITIDPVTRIEGHSKITIHLGDDGSVSEAQLHITQFRGFEKFCEGRPFYEMPSLMARICGICPVSHLIASSKACDALLAVDVPETGAKLRRILNLAQIVQSDALSFFHLSAPDLLLGMDAPPEQRNLFSLMTTHPDVARDGIRLRKFGQHIIETLGGKRIHPAWVVPGGVNEPLSPEHREQLLATIPEALDIIQRTLTWFKPLLPRFEEEISVFGNFPSLFMGLVTPEGDLEHYDGLLRIADAAGQPVVPDFDPRRFTDYIGEAVEEWSYLKFPYFKPMGYPDGVYRVGSLAHINIIRQCGTPLADAELEAFRTLPDSVRLSSFHFHYARLIDILFAIERLQELLTDPEILSTRVRAHAEPNRTEGIGVSEAPRGTLMHHYKIDDNGLITWANLIIATGHNNLAMNKGITQVAKHYIQGPEIPEGMLNRVEAVIRTYDPCLSCSTHAVGQMSLWVQLIGPSGELLDEIAHE
jgi:NAD-reducing hydrogenase large subunit